ncbi:MAG: 4-(cytidine 5'-diphospho)-2-C-methyl-D-erythritol kinase, partial [Oxalobacter sp.]|nr:4-(cytidine 5'-diphospho)-2-C-methyl-D-erythritol kinase [Oxalobacter sp.]
PAKLNLFLHVVGRRPDGYHLLESAFQLIDLCDRLHFINRSDGVIHRLSEMEGVPEETDLTVRAATRLKKEALAKKGQRVPGVDISIEKSIPAGGGLGGGSSDAATTLMVLNKLWNCGFTLQDLARIGVSLGADVPFFLFRQNAFVQGIGEIMTPIETPSGWFVVIKPPIFVPTKLIFQSPELTRSTERIKMKSYPYFCDSYIQEGKNDLQPVAVSLFPEIQEALDDLGQYGNARMTGSGACVFAYFESEGMAREAEEGLSSRWEVMVVRSLKQHPLDLTGIKTGS